MCDGGKLIVLNAGEEDKITVTIDPWGIWENFSDETKEIIVADAMHWHIIKESLEYQLGNSLSTPSYNNSIHKLREMIVTDTEFVNDITVTFIKQILEEWAKAEQDKRESWQAFWKLYRQLRDSEQWTDKRIKIACPGDINRDDDYLRMSTKEVREEIMDKFRDLLKKGAEDNE